MNLSYEIGAFVAGVAVATSPVARFIAESLRPLRDFFLVMFFFALGAGFDPAASGSMVLPAILLAALVIALKPLVFGLLFTRTGEARDSSFEIGVRLGQLSEFSLLVVFIALQSGVAGERHRRPGPARHHPHLHRLELPHRPALPHPHGLVGPTAAGLTPGT